MKEIDFEFKQYLATIPEDCSDELVSQKTDAAISKIIVDYGGKMTLLQKGVIRHISRLSNGAKRAFLSYYENHERRRAQTAKSRNYEPISFRKNNEDIKKLSQNLICCYNFQSPKHDFRQPKDGRPSEEDFRELYDYIRGLDPNPFGTAVEALKKQKKMKSSDIYNAVNMSRQVYNNAISGENVSRKMVWKIIFGLKCTAAEADELLKAAGYYPWSRQMDMFLLNFLLEKKYNIVRIDIELYEAGFDTLQGPSKTVKNKRPKAKQ